MASSFFTDVREKSTGGLGAKTGHRGTKASFGPEKTAAWPSLPGKTQPKDRSNGIKKLKTYAKDEGI